MRFVNALAVILFCYAWASAQDAIRNGDPFTLHVTEVRSIAPEGHVGFSKTLEVYAVNARGPQKSYVLYCTKSAPQAGQDYTALDEYVSANYSWLHLWPVERTTLQESKKKKGRLYRVIIIQNMSPEPKPDAACDIHSESAYNLSGTALHLLFKFCAIEIEVRSQSRGIIRPLTAT